MQNCKNNQKTKPQSRQMLRLTHLRCHCCIEGADHVHLNLGSGGSGIFTKFATLAFTVIYCLVFSGWLSWLWNDLDISWSEWSCKYLDWVLYRVICRLGTVAHRVYYSILRKARPRRVHVQVWSLETRQTSQRSAEDRRGQRTTRSNAFPTLVWMGLSLPGHDLLLSD